MLSFLQEWIDSYELLKAVVIACVLVFMIRMWAHAVKDRAEEDNKKREIEDVEKENKLKDEIVPVSKTIYEGNDCCICKKPIWTRDGIEIERCSTVELKCTHCFHAACVNKKSSASSLTDTTYVMVEKVPRCPICHFQPTAIEVEPLHKWQTVRFWVLLIDEALDQLAHVSGRNGISWANVRARVRKMSGISLEQLAKGERQTHGEEEMHDEEDLDGPGSFPYFAALKDCKADRFFNSIDNLYHKSAGKWLTYQSNRGGERMVFKYSWGVPPSTECRNCQKLIDSTSKENTRDWNDCKVCGHLGEKKLYWCSQECYASHAGECKALLNKWERFRITKNLS